MSAAIVRFPEGREVAPLTEDDERVLALLGRSLAAWWAFDSVCSELEEAGTAEAEAEQRRLNAAIDKPQDELRSIAKSDRLIFGWFEHLGVLARLR